MFSMSGSSVQPACSDSTSVAPSWRAEHLLHLFAAASTIGSSTAACFTMNSRMMPMRIPFSAPGVPGRDGTSA